MIPHVRSVILERIVSGEMFQLSGSMAFYINRDKVQPRNSRLGEDGVECSFRHHFVNESSSLACYPLKMPGRFRELFLRSKRQDFPHVMVQLCWLRRTRSNAARAARSA
jgi:hypothetical protein